MTVKNYTPIDHLLKTKTPVVSLPKEAEPLRTKPETTVVQEVVEHQPNKEVAPFVKPRQETVKLEPEIKTIGAQTVNHTKFPTYEEVKLPIPDEKVIQGLHAPVTSSMRWLATIAEYLLKTAHLKLKVVGGKVVRVLTK